MNRKDYLDDSFIKQISKKKWDTTRAKEWYAEQPWLVGCNYIPSTAINQLEMFQEDTFDPGRIDEELGWAENLGFNALRIYLHFLLWKADFSGLKKRMNRLLEICDKHKMKVLFVLFYDCWHQDPKIGTQPEPILGVHNSGWAASPGRKRVLGDQYYPELQEYVQDVISTYAKDKRIIGWDLYNEPGNSNMKEKSLPLVIASFSWARELNPTQPITVGIYYVLSQKELWEKLCDICYNCSDIISFHHYGKVEKTMGAITYLKKIDRPMLCTEYMARTNGNYFNTHLPIFKQHTVGAFNWGLVSGKTQTIYSWASPKGGSEPEIWFHDIFYEDGTPYSQEEVDFIKSILKT